MNKLSLIKRSVLFGSTILAILFLITTSFQNIQNHPLQSISAQMLPSFSLNDAQVLIHAQVMTSSDSKNNFGHDLLSRGIKPLHLTIQNNTAHAYSMCESSVDLPSVSARAVTSKIMRSSLARTIGYKIAGFLFWPFAIPGTIDGIRGMIHQKRLKADITAKSMKQEVLAPYSTFNRVLFVPDGKLKEHFQITLIDLETLQPTECQMDIN